MAAKRRLFLTGSERAEFEHIWGPLTEDSADPRFVLVDEETEEKIAVLPPGVPVRSGQHPADKAAVRAQELEAFGVDASDDVGGERGGKAKPLDIEADRSGSSDRKDEVTGKGETSTNVAASGTPSKSKTSGNS